MYEFVVHACIFVWALIALIIGGTVLFLIPLAAIQHIFVTAINSRNNSYNEKDNS